MAAAMLAGWFVGQFQRMKGVRCCLVAKNDWMAGVQHVAVVSRNLYREAVWMLTMTGGCHSFLATRKVGNFEKSPCKASIDYFKVCASTQLLHWCCNGYSLHNTSQWSINFVVVMRTSCKLRLRKTCLTDWRLTSVELLNLFGPFALDR